MTCALSLALTGLAGKDNKMLEIKIPARVEVKCTPGSPCSQPGALFCEFVKWGLLGGSGPKAGWVGLEGYSPASVFLSRLPGSQKWEESQSHAPTAENSARPSLSGWIQNKPSLSCFDRVTNHSDGEQ